MTKLVVSFCTFRTQKSHNCFNQQLDDSYMQVFLKLLFGFQGSSGTIREHQPMAETLHRWWWVDLWRLCSSIALWHPGPGLFESRSWQVGWVFFWRCRECLGWIFHEGSMHVTYMILIYLLVKRCMIRFVCQNIHVAVSLRSCKHFLPVSTSKRGKKELRVSFSS